MSIANFSFKKKVIEKAISSRIHRRLINKENVDNIQSAYKAGNSSETTLLRVYNAIVRGNGAMVFLLYFSVSFDTIDRDNQFCILEKYVSICVNA